VAGAIAFGFVVVVVRAVGRQQVIDRIGRNRRRFAIKKSSLTRLQDI
jgi:hypothetical protein